MGRPGRRDGENQFVAERGIVTTTRSRHSARPPKMGKFSYDILTKTVEIVSMNEPVITRLNFETDRAT